MITIGTKVHLRGCRAGEPGTVIRKCRGKLTVYWKDIDFWSKHQPETLVEAEDGEVICQSMKNTNK